MLADKYRLDWMLGHGAMGQVWRGRDLNVGRDIAVKLLLTSEADPDLLRRFEREPRAAARLKHPGIMVVHDAGWHGGQMFIVMELLRGQELRKIITRHPTGLPVSRSVELAIQLADALEAVHAHDIVHRDLKPANLMVENGDRLKICDFGIARDNSASTQRGHANSVGGTPLYAPPEWWLGKPVSAEPSADMYAMGGILYEMLTGSAPFEGAPSIAEVMRRHLDEAPVPPSHQVANVPPALDGLVLGLLAKEPEQRPGATRALAALREVKRALDRKPGPGPTPNLVPVTAPLACTSASKDHREIFVLAGNRSLKSRTYWPEEAWSGWHGLSLAPGQLSAIAASSYGEHQKVAAASGGDVYHRWRDGRGGWSNWHSMPPLAAKVVDLAFFPLTPGHWEVFAVDAAGRIHRRSWRGTQDRAAGWSQWRDVPAPDGHPVTAIAADTQYSHLDSDGLDRRGLSVIIDGEVWHRWLRRYPDGKSTWFDWQPVPGLRSRAADIASVSVGRGDSLFVVDDAGQLWTCQYSDKDGWSPWGAMSAPPGETLTAIAGTCFVSHQKLAVLTIRGHVFHAWGTPANGWSPWRDLQAAVPTQQV